ncbi:hypothetical protein [Croceicoccus sp. YJ47]|uniref:hypothetical protein n=1 Tax=Croceicoccus sp. YJ47 TaxID=2798724 RepID=UPI001922735D|nr:hypothetical protein [Croceicoccus sp. YJ47]QQN75527.1 hypothetical protein JD971_07915 [Croceicoccus sp. YJ47]
MFNQKRSLIPNMRFGADQACALCIGLLEICSTTAADVVTTGQAYSLQAGIGVGGMQINDNGGFAAQRAMVMIANQPPPKELVDPRDFRYLNLLTPEFYHAECNSILRT